MKQYSQTPKGAYVVNLTLSQVLEDAERMLVSSIKTQPKAFRFPVLRESMCETSCH